MGSTFVAAACFCIVSAVMLSAGASDMRRREVPDIHWKAVFAVGIPCSALVMAESFPVPAVLLAACSSVFMALHALSDALPWWASLPASGALAAASYLSASGTPGGWMLLAPFSSSALFLLMYHSRLLVGGADAKALISMSSMPQHPSAQGLPLLWQAGWPMSAVPLSVSVLLVAAVLSLAPMSLVGARNLREGRACARMLTERRMPLDEARASFVWPCEDAPEGAVVRRRVTEGEKEAYDRLERAGAEDV